MFAALSMDDDIARLLLTAHADPNARSLEGRSALSYAVARSEEGRAVPDGRPLFKLLLAHGASTAGVPRTPALIAALRKRPAASRR
jgi:ankyrin repeat protein